MAKEPDPEALALYRAYALILSWPAPPKQPQTPIQEEVYIDIHPKKPVCIDAHEPNIFEFTPKIREERI